MVQKCNFFLQTTTFFYKPQLFFKPQLLSTKHNFFLQITTNIYKLQLYSRTPDYFLQSYNFLKKSCNFFVQSCNFFLQCFNFFQQILQLNIKTLTQFRYYDCDNHKVQPSTQNFKWEPEPKRRRRWAKPAPQKSGLKILDTRPNVVRILAKKGSRDPEQKLVLLLI